MLALFDLFTSPFGLPINPLYEYAILAAIGILAFILAYRAAGRFGSDPYERRGLHWFFRILFFVGIWAIVRFAIWIISLF